MSDDEMLTWHDSGAMDYRASPPPVAEPEREMNEGDSNMGKYAIGATVGATAVLLLPTACVVGAGVAAGAAMANRDKVSHLYEKHTGRSSAGDGQAVKKAMAATISGAKSAGRVAVQKFRKMSSGNNNQQRPPGNRGYD